MKNLQQERGFGTTDNNKDCMFNFIVRVPADVCLFMCSLAENPGLMGHMYNFSTRANT